MRAFFGLIFLLVGTAASDFGQLRAPRAGIARYADGTVRVIRGIDGNYIANEKSSVTAQHAAFSDAGGLVATSHTLELLDVNLKVLGEVPIDDASPLLNIDRDLNSAIAWVPHHQSLIYWNGAGFSQTEVRDPINGTPTWVSLPDSKHAELLTVDESGNTFSATVSLESGNVLSVQPVPGVTGPAHRLGPVFAALTASGLRIYLADQTSVNFPLAVDDLVVERMASNSLHLSSRSGRGDWVLHLDVKGAHLWELPGGSGK